MKKKLAFLFASFFCVGYTKYASGTFGSLASFILIVPCGYYWGAYGIIGMTLLSFLVGWLSSIEVLKYTKHDPSLIVIDETAGQTITFLLVSDLLKNNSSCWYLYLIGFILFRLFDIKKPYLIGIIDKKIENAFGVMFDDVMAGLLATSVLYLITLMF